MATTLVVLFICLVFRVYAAINLNGTHAFLPAKGWDSSPISDPADYVPDQHDCPLPCIDLSNMHSWTPYFSVERLQRCDEPMLLKLSVIQALDDPKSNIIIRSCTLGSRIHEHQFHEQQVENPKKDNKLAESSLDTAPACFANGTETARDFSVFSEGGGKLNSTQAMRLIEGMQNFFLEPSNCDENIVFAYYKQTVASVYLGEGFGKATVLSLLSAVKSIVFGSTRSVVQLCGSGQLSELVFGIFFDGRSDLLAAQKAAEHWSEGSCVEPEGLSKSSNLENVKTWEIAQRNSTTSNSTLSIASGLHKRAECRYITVVAGDGCGSLISRCGVSNADFTKFNPNSNLCSTLRAGDYVCCSTGTPHTDPKPDPPKPGSDGTCATHIIDDHDTCDKLSKIYGVTIDNLEKWNKGKAWAWTACGDMLIGYNSTFLQSFRRQGAQTSCMIYEISSDCMLC
jgi:hypothetical protein